MREVRRTTILHSWVGKLMILRSRLKVTSVMDCLRCLDLLLMFHFLESYDVRTVVGTMSSPNTMKDAVICTGVSQRFSPFSLVFLPLFALLFVVSRP